MDNKDYGKRFHYDKTFFEDPKKLGRISLVQTGELYVEPTYIIEKHCQICSEISYIISGSGIFEHNGKSMKVSCGDIVVTPATGYHSIRASENEALFYSYCGFDFNDGVKDIPEAILDFYRQTNQICRRDNTGIYEYYRKCTDEYYNETEESRILIESNMMQIIIGAYRLFCACSSSKTYSNKCGNSGELVYRIIKYIDKNICGKLTVLGISQELGYSPYYISHIFKEKMGITLKEYIRDRKTDKAKQLLKLNSFSVSAVAKQLDYENTQAFSRAFYRSTGKNPSDYLKQEHK